MNIANFRYIAQYDCGAYGSSAYSNGQVCATQTGATGPLANTGLDVIVPLATGVLLIGVAIVLIVRHLRKQKTAVSRS